MNKEIEEFLKQHNDFVFDSKINKIRCETTKHEIPLRLDQLKIHLNSKSYKNAIIDQYDFTKYAPNIVPSTSHERRLYCKITKKELNKVPEEIERHINGRQYKSIINERLNGKKKRINHDKDAENDGAEGEEASDDDAILNFNSDSEDEVENKQNENDDDDDENDDDDEDDEDDGEEDDEENDEEINSDDDEDEDDDSDDDDEEVEDFEGFDHEKDMIKSDNDSSSSSSSDDDSEEEEEKAAVKSKAKSIPKRSNQEQSNNNNNQKKKKQKK
ncbi:hypothetical protein PPL_02890 [Heterostelium album PN500]|uniref:Surfeit locus protein 2 n=1 Tax=Heterostelium pallidum (strain ATCC 26659 / Pp 5 / PN500) TaxID=670386 RepID=D3B3C4_HETP5|nr:hypothetical protein PPL_02890 [Heterostelium album PN500]EFA83822.1 hypothetical protein PPL_02890 [Heterostelium album PN500]|eukprot:XP_020435939.1 hypothetical protein PPL_02890 [Heterostelium album PN500]